MPPLADVADNDDDDDDDDEDMLSTEPSVRRTGVDTTRPRGVIAYKWMDSEGPRGVTGPSDGRRRSVREGRDHDLLIMHVERLETIASSSGGRDDDNGDGSCGRALVHATVLARACGDRDARTIDAVLLENCS